MHRKSHRLASWIYATLFSAIATYHFFVLLDSEMPHAAVLRHLVFFAIDVTFAVLVWQWRRWLILPVGLLTVQQFWAHSKNVWRAWHHGLFDPLGTLSLVGLTILCYLLVKDELLKRRN